MIEHLIRKHSVLLSVFFALCALAAAPYLVPENPDSMVFRSGFLSTLLLCAAAYPVMLALKRVALRRLFFGLLCGFLFSAALSLGSELFVYGGLLPGAGSAIRRFAVPLLAAPFFGCLAALLMSLSFPSNYKTIKIPFYVFFFSLLLLWAPILLAYFPGLLNYDFPGQYGQHISGIYSSNHPLLHSVILNSVIALGERLGSPSLGLLMMSLLQMALFSVSLADACCLIRDHGVPVLAQIALLLLFGLHPLFSVMSISMTKDTLFAACVLLLSLGTWRLLENPEAFWRHKLRSVAFAAAVIGTALLRNNGVFAIVPLFIALLCTAKHKQRTIILLASSAVSCLIIFLGLQFSLRPESIPTHQFYSLPAQELVRVYNTGDMTPQEQQDLKGFYWEIVTRSPDHLALQLHPHIADASKDFLNSDKLAEDGDRFLELWARVGKRNPRLYLEAFLLLNIGSWYPDDLTHAAVYSQAYGRDLGYLQTQEYDMTEYDIHTTSLLPAVRDLYERICRRNDYQEYPIISVLFCTATPLWVLVFSCCHFAAKRRARMIVPALGALGLWLSYLFGPCTLPRYTLPLFCLAPVLLILSYCHSKKEISHD